MQPIPLLIAITLLTAFASSLVALGLSRYPTMVRILSSFLLVISGITAVISGGWTLIDAKTTVFTLPFGLPWLQWHFRLDALSGFFFIIVGLSTTAANLFAPSYLRELSQEKSILATLGWFQGLFIAGMLLVLLADDALSFMVAWELMSFSSYFLVAYQHTHSANRRAAFLYLLMAHIGGLSILMAFGIAASFGNGLTFDAMRQADIPLTWATLAFGFGLFGFGMKAGLVPTHVWLPEAHPVAPSHISALMSGVMLKIAIYGLVRLIFDLLTTLHWSWGLILLIMGSTSALLGILYALMQNDLKRLLAYSSIENVGIICAALGLSILFMATGQTAVGVLGMIAALYHALNHSVFKSLLFLGAGAIAHVTHEKSLERMGGLIHHLPYTSVFFLIGSISIAALPPLNGFVSEWLTFQTALQVPHLESGLLRTVVPFSAALLALTTALSSMCFVKVYGVAFLGQARTRHARHVNEVTWDMRIGLGLLAIICLLLGIFPTFVVNTLEHIPLALTGTGLPNELGQNWLWLTPISSEVASYSAPLVLLFIVGVWGGVYVMSSDAKKIRRRSHSWDCGFGEGNARMQYTATAFVMPIRRIFHPVWEIEEHVKEKADATLNSTCIHYQLHVEDHSWALIYQPIGHWVTKIARQVGRIQTGNIRLYLAYSFFTLLFLLWIIT